MPAADVPRDAIRFRMFAADIRTGEAEVERVEGAAGNSCRHRRHDARVDAAAHERAERHVGDEHRFDGTRETGVELFEGDRFRKIVLRHVGRPPEFAGGERALLDRQPMAGGELADRAIDAARRGDVLALEVQRERVDVDRVRQPGKQAQRLQLRAERQRAIVPPVVERLDAEMVAREEQLAPATVPQREREHAGQPVEHPRAPGLPAVDQHFAVALRDEDVSGGRELVPQCAEIVDLAVEDDGDRAVGGDERLVAACDVDHRQPAKAESDRSVEEETVVIGAAMRKRGRHRRQCRARPGIVGEIAGDAAHGKRRCRAAAGRRSAHGSAVRDYSLAPSES